MTPDEPANGFAARMAFALEKDPDEPVRRQHITLQITTAILAWIVVVPILVVFGLTGTHRDSDVILLAALCTPLGPFVAAVIAVRHRRASGGLFVLLTLLMVLPAIWIVRVG